MASSGDAIGTFWVSVNPKRNRLDPTTSSELTMMGTISALGSGPVGQPGKAADDGADTEGTDEGASLEGEPLPHAATPSIETAIRMVSAAGQRATGPRRRRGIVGDDSGSGCIAPSRPVHLAMAAVESASP